MTAKTSNELWAVTCYFNPCGYARRLANYREFRRRLSVPLVTVELAYGAPSMYGAPSLGRDEADIVVQLQGRDVLWQKERLLNLALDAVPRSCQKIAWLDCDVLFRSPRWAREAAKELERFPLLQPFQVAWRAGPGGTRDGTTADNELERALTAGSTRERSLAHGIATGTWKDDIFTSSGLRSILGCATGLAGAARREVLEQHGLYDGCILGGGDVAFWWAAFGRADAAAKRLHMNAVQARHYLAWAGSLHDTVAGQVGCIEGEIIDLWHGELNDRQYATRHDGLLENQFDPTRDIALDANGAWRWATQKPLLHDYVKAYFRSRREDGHAAARGTPTAES